MAICTALLLHLQYNTIAKMKISYSYSLVIVISAISTQLQNAYVKRKPHSIFLLDEEFCLQNFVVFLLLMR